MQFYRVKNWDRFQHYRDRNPPWIKLHFELLSSPDWVVLDDASRVLAVACMLIASRNNGEIPADPHYMRRVAYLNALPKFKPLLDCGFLENTLATASTLQADARPETETEVVSKKESKPPLSPKQVFELPDGIPAGDWTDYLAMRQRIRKPMTERAMRLAVAKLLELKAEGNEPATVLQNSVMNSWTGLFAPNQNRQQTRKIAAPTQKNIMDD